MHLIANRWYAILSSRELSGTRPVGRRRLGLDLVFWRTPEGVAVALDSCPHRKAKLSLGRVEKGCIECPFHGFTFDGAGHCTSVPAHPERAIPAALALDTLPVREEHGLVWVWTGPDPAPAEPVPFFDFRGYSFEGSEFTEEVAIHYTRGIENQLDFAHLPFVHRTTIGLLTGKRFDVRTEVQGDSIVARVDEPKSRIELLGPNIWRNETGPVWQFLAFAPIDEGRMIYYVRTYQPFVTVRGLAWVVGRLNRFFNRMIVRQDTRVVETQPAGETRLRGTGEVFVPSDLPIVAYRRWREERRADFDPRRDRGPKLVEARRLRKRELLERLAG